MNGGLAAAAVVVLLVVVPNARGVDYGYQAPAPAPSYQAPAYQAPAYQAPSYQAPSYQEPSYQAPSYQAPSYQAPSYQAPAYQAPSYQAPAYQAPSYQAPSYQAPSYQAPSYQAPAPYYQAPTYYETQDTYLDYKEANQSRHCGIFPAVHQQYGYQKERVSFGEIPWQVAVMGPGTPGSNYYGGSAGGGAGGYGSSPVYKCAGALISSRHVVTSSYCVEGMSEDQISVRVGEWDLMSDRNYQEVYKNYEISVCKKHPYYYVPQSYSSSYPAPQEGSNPQASYPVVILELSEDVDWEQYPHTEPLCLPETYYLSKSYTNQYNPPSYSYGGYGSGSGSQSQGPQQQASFPSDRNEQGADKDLECWVMGYQEAPLERIEYQTVTQNYKPASYAYGEQYQSYDSYTSYTPAYEDSRTPRKAKLRKLYTPYQESYGYGYTPPSDTWEGEYYYDACHADLGSPIFCLVEGRYDEESYYPAYPVNYPQSYQAPTYQAPAYQAPAYQAPSYQAPSYQAPSYQAPSYQAPSYQAPSYQAPAPSYQAPSYQEPSYQVSTYSPRYKRATYGYQQQQSSYQAPQYQQSYQAPAYQAPSYQTPAYQAPSYQAPSYQAPAYQAPSYQAPQYQQSYSYSEPYYAYPIRPAEGQEKEYRRAVLYGVVQYPTTCSYEYGAASSSKITATPGKELSAWMSNVLSTPTAYCAAPAYQAPAYQAPAYQAPAYQAPAASYDSYAAPAAPAYQAPSYQAPSYQAPSYQAPAASYDSYAAPSYQSPAPSYQAPQQQSYY